MLSTQKADLQISDICFRSVNTYKGHRKQALLAFKKSINNQPLKLVTHRSSAAES